MAAVKIYSTPNCPYCKMAKQFLTQNNVAFEDIDVSVNQLAAQEMISRSGQMGVPVLDLDGRIVVGFDKNKIKQLLNLPAAGGS
jgi:glutaredoxin 3